MVNFPSRDKEGRTVVTFAPGFHIEPSWAISHDHSRQVRVPLWPVCPSRRKDMLDLWKPFLLSLKPFWKFFLQRSRVAPLAVGSPERLGPRAVSVSLTPLAKHLTSLIRCVWSLCLSQLLILSVAGEQSRRCAYKKALITSCNGHKPKTRFFEGTRLWILWASASYSFLAPGRTTVDHIFWLSSQRKFLKEMIDKALKAEQVNIPFKVQVSQVLSQEKWTRVIFISLDVCTH